MGNISFGEPSRRTAEETTPNPSETFFNGLLHMDKQRLADQLCADTGRRLEDLRGS